MEGEDTTQSQCKLHGYQKYSWWLNPLFSGNIFGVAFNIDVVKQSMKKKNHLLQKALEDNMSPTVKKCVKLKSKLQLKCFIILKSVIYLGVSTIV